MPTITFATTGKKLEVEKESNLLRMSIRYEGDVPFKCGGGMCGTCLVKIEEGNENLNKASNKELQKLGQEKIEDGFRLACQTFINGDVTISWGNDDVERLNKIAVRRVQRSI